MLFSLSVLFLNYGVWWPETLEVDGSRFSMLIPSWLRLIIPEFD